MKDWWVTGFFPLETGDGFIVFLSLVALGLRLRWQEILSWNSALGEPKSMYEKYISTEDAMFSWICFVLYSGIQMSVQFIELRAIWIISLHLSVFRFSFTIMPPWNLTRNKTEKHFRDFTAALVNILSSKASLSSLLCVFNMAWDLFREKELTLIYIYLSIYSTVKTF